MANMLRYTLAALAFVLFFAGLVVGGELQQHRVDITTGQGAGEGASWFGNINMLRPANYTAKGRRLLCYLYALQIAWLALSASLLAQFVLS